MLALDGIAFGYDGRAVLKGITVAVDRGERLAVVGANGAGKTTLLRIAAGLQEPDSGSVDGEGVVGFAPEDPEIGLFAATVRGEVAFFPRNRGLDVADAVSSALESMGLTALEDRNPFTLSRGEQRRVSIASVLAGDPAVLALDEPTKGLDRRDAHDLGRLLRDRDTTLVYSTHDTDFAYATADRVAVLADGGFRALGSPREVLGDEPLLRAAGVRPPGLVSLARQEGLARLPRDIDDAVAMLRGEP